MPNKESIQLKIILKATLSLLIYIFLAWGIYKLSDSMSLELFVPITLIFALFIHSQLNKMLITFIHFNEVQRAVLDDQRTFKFLNKKERLFHHLIFLPVSAALLGLFLVGSITFSLIGLSIIYIILLLGEASKYRFNLYFTFYNKNVL